MESQPVGRRCESSVQCQGRYSHRSAAARHPEGPVALVHVMPDKRAESAVTPLDHSSRLIADKSRLLPFRRNRGLFTIVSVGSFLLLHNQRPRLVMIADVASIVNFLTSFASFGETMA